MPKNETFDETKNRYKKKIKSFVEAHPLEIGFVGTMSVIAFFYYAGYRNGKMVGQAMELHGPCMEIASDAAEGLLNGKFMITKVIGDDIFYKIVDVDIDALLA